MGFSHAPARAAITARDSRLPRRLHAHASRTKTRGANASQPRVVRVVPRPAPNSAAIALFLLDTSAQNLKTYPRRYAACAFRPRKPRGVPRYIAIRSISDLLSADASFARQARDICRRTQWRSRCRHAHRLPSSPWPADAVFKARTSTD